MIEILLHENMEAMFGIDWPCGDESAQSSSNKKNVAYTEDRIPVRCLYVSSIKAMTSESAVRAYFEKLGNVESFRIHDKKDYKYAFVTYATYEEASHVLNQKHYLKGNGKLKVQMADSWHQPKEVKEDAAGATAEGGEGAAVGACKETPALPVDENGMNILDLNDDCLLHILDELEVIDLARMSGLAKRFDGLIAKIAHRFKIFNFDLVREDEVTLMEARDIFRVFGDHFEQLFIDADKFINSHYRVLDFIGRNCKHLEHLELTGFHLSKPKIEKLGPVLETLKSLNIGNCRFNDDIGRHLEAAQRLENLDISLNYEITGRCIARLSGLLSLNVDNCSNLLPKPFVQFLQKNQTLRTLNINRCDKLDSAACQGLVDNLKQLERLVMSNSYSKIDDYTKFAQLENLRALTIVFRDFHTVDHLLEKLAERDQLEELDFSQSQMSKDTIDIIGRFSRLRVLKLCYKADLTDEQLATVSEKGTLEELHIPGCRVITERGVVEVVRRCPRLKVLEISKVGITEAAVVNVIKVLRTTGEERPRLKMIVYETSIMKEFLQDNQYLEARHLIELNFTPHSIQRLEYMDDSDEEDFYNSDIDDDDFLGFRIDDDDDVWDDPYGYVDGWEDDYYNFGHYKSGWSTDSDDQYVD